MRGPFRQGALGSAPSRGSIAIGTARSAHSGRDGGAARFSAPSDDGGGIEHGGREADDGGRGQREGGEIRYAPDGIDERLREADVARLTAAPRHRDKPPKHRHWPQHDDK